MSDAARWYLESNNYIGQLWRDTITATVWHGGAMAGTIPGKSAQNFANQINYFDFFLHLIRTHGPVQRFSANVSQRKPAGCCHHVGRAATQVTRDVDGSVQRHKLHPRRIPARFRHEGHVRHNKRARIACERGPDPGYEQSGRRFGATQRQPELPDWNAIHHRFRRQSFHFHEIDSISNHIG